MKFILYGLFLAAIGVGAAAAAAAYRKPEGDKPKPATPKPKATPAPEKTAATDETPAKPGDLGDKQVTAEEWFGDGEGAELDQTKAGQAMPPKQMSAGAEAVDGDMSQLPEIENKVIDDDEDDEATVPEVEPIREDAAKSEDDEATVPVVPDAEAAAKEAPADEPKADEPKAEEPAAKEAPADEPKAEAPAKEAEPVEVKGVKFTGMQAMKALSLVNNSDDATLEGHGLKGRPLSVLTDNRPFASVEAMADTKGVGKKTLQTILAAVK